MLNYIKSEFYRVTRSLSTYITLGIFLGLALSVNCGLAIIGAVNPSFAYANTSFSMQFLMQLPTIFVCAAPILVYVLYDDLGKNGALKNAVAFGISREKLLLGQFIISLTFCLFVMLATLAVYFASAYAFLKYDPTIPSSEVMREALCVLLPAIAAMVLAIVCANVTSKGVLGIAIWMVIYYFVPYVCRWIGYQVDFFAKIAEWMPMTFMDMQGATEIFWQTKEGVEKCLVSGAAGIAIFAVVGWLLLRRKEI